MTPVAAAGTGRRAVAGRKTEASAPPAVAAVRPAAGPRAAMKLRGPEQPQAPVALPPLKAGRPGREAVPSVPLGVVRAAPPSEGPAGVRATNRYRPGSARAWPPRT